MHVCRPVSDPPVSTRWLLSLSKTPCKTLYCTLLHRKPFWNSFALQVSTVTHSLYVRRWLVCKQSPTTGHSAASQSVTAAQTGNRDPWIMLIWQWGTTCTLKLFVDKSASSLQMHSRSNLPLTETITRKFWVWHPVCNWDSHQPPATTHHFSLVTGDYQGVAVQSRPVSLQLYPVYVTVF